MLYDIFDSPFGRLTISTVDGAHLAELHMEGDRYFTAIPSSWTRDSSHPLLQRANQELEEYFAGRRTSFDVPIRPTGTPFQEAVWQRLPTIPAGTTTSYTKIAQSIGKPLAVRAVGSAIGRNPICIIVPCHRVITSKGTLGGYAAGLKAKERLLAIESR